MDVPYRFESLIQDALDHLFDPAYLLVHPLAAARVGPSGSEPPGQAMHRALREAIARLKPSSDAPLHSPAWRSFHYLSLRYVEMLTMGQVARELGVSPRQCRRDHHEALSALCSILRGQFQLSEETQSLDDRPSPGRLGIVVERSTGELLEAEIGKMGSTSATVATDLGAVITSVAATLAVLAERKQVTLQIDVSAAVPPVVVDRTVLRQLLLELLLYTLDLATGGQVALSISGSADAVRLVVSARHPGGASNSRARSASRDDTRLAVCRQLAELQGLTLHVESSDLGLEASVSFPSDEAPIVLVVDDNADVIHLFRHYLDGMYEVVEATSGEQALSLARQLQPRVITLDVMMPSQDGWEVLQTIKHDPATEDIPVIVCSVLRERELALSLGAADYLAKPVTGPQLVSALHRCRLAS